LIPQRRKSTPSKITDSKREDNRMVSFQAIRVGAQALRESELGAMAVAGLGDAATTASKLLSDAYPSARGMLSRATELFKGTAAAGAEESTAGMTAAERSTLPGSKRIDFDAMMANYRAEKATGFASTKAAVAEQTTGGSGFDALSRQVEKIQGISPFAKAPELPRSLEGIRASFETVQPAATKLEIGSARSLDLRTFDPSRSSGLATQFRASELRYPPLTAMESGTAQTGARAAQTERAVSVVADEAEGAANASESAGVASKVRRTRRVRAAQEGEEASTATKEVKTRARRPRRGAESTEVSGETEAPATIAEKPAKVAEAPAKVAEAPVKVGEAPAKVAEAPAKVAEAPAKVAEAPAKVAEAPAKVSEAPASEVAETLEAEGGQAEAAAPKLNRHDRRALARKGGKPDRRLARSAAEEELDSVRRA
jgi:hypothetical protein